MAHRGRPSRAGPQRSIRGGIGRRPPIVAPNLPIPVGPGDFDDEGDPRPPWIGAHGGSVELFQDQLMRKFGGGRIKKQTGGTVSRQEDWEKIGKARMADAPKDPQIYKSFRRPKAGQKRKKAGPGGYSAGGKTTRSKGGKIKAKKSGGKIKAKKK